MPKQISLTELIQETGEKIQTDLPPNASVLDRACEWQATHGLNRTEESTQILCDLAAFNRLLKTTLYALYKLDGYDLPTIEDPSEITHRLSEAQDKTEAAAFNQYVLDEVADAVNHDVFSSLLDARYILANSDKPTDEFGRILEHVVPQGVRRKIGQFRTPEYLANTMAEWTVESGDEKVLDPGIGAGVLTASVYGKKQSTDKTASINEVWGVDLSELGVVMTSTALKLVNGEGTPHLHAIDFMDVIPDGESGQIDQKSPRKIPKVDAVVSNPPYSRHHELSTEEKNRVNRIAEAESGMTISKRASMYHYFYVHAAQFLAEGGRMSFITPSEFLETNYGEQLKEFLLENFAIHGLVLHETDIEVFEGTATTSCLSFLERNKSNLIDNSTTFVHLSEWPGQDEVMRAVRGEVEGETDYGFVNHVKQRDLLPELKWTNFVDPNSVDAIPSLKPFREIADVKRGIATGNNDYFCLTQTEAENHGLSDKFLAKLIRRTSGMEYYDIRQQDWQKWREAGEEVYLLYLYEDGEIVTDISDQAVQDYLEDGKGSGAADGYLTQDRNPWYKVDRREPASILVTYMSKGGFRFIHNKAAVRSVNNLHNVYINTDYSELEVEALLAYLNSTVVNDIVAQSGRSYSDGLQKIEPNELKNIPVIDPKDLDPESVETLSYSFELLTSAARTSEIPIKKAIKDIDEKVMEVLDLPLPNGSS